MKAIFGREVGGFRRESGYRQHRGQMGFGGELDE